MEKYETFEEIFEQLESCDYECEGGKLEGNIAYMELKKILLSE